MNDCEFYFRIFFNDFKCVFNCIKNKIYLNYFFVLLLINFLK